VPSRKEDGWRSRLCLGTVLKVLPDGGLFGDSAGRSVLRDDRSAAQSRSYFMISHRQYVVEERRFEIFEGMDLIGSRRSR